MKNHKILIFDLDGTITDSGEGIMRCAQYALAQFGIEVRDLQELRPFVGPPLEDSFKDFYNFSPSDAEKAVEAYRARYFEKGIYEQHLYDNIETTLLALKECGYVLAIGTSKTKQQAEFVLNYFKLLHYFDFVGGRDEEGILIHTKADVLRSVLSELGASPNECLMIGDRKFDILGAKECNIPSVGVLWGYGDKSEFEAAGADYIIESQEELLDFLS